MSPKLVIKKSLLIAFLVFITIEISLAAPIVLDNTNETGIIIHPPETHVYYHINTTLHSLTPMMIESKYIMISGVLVEIDASAYTDVYINSFQPEHIAVPNATIINITVAPKYPDTEVHFYFGNLTKVPLIVYKDGEPYLVAFPSEFHSFVGKVNSSNSDSTISFFDGKNASRYINALTKSISEVRENESVVVFGRVVNVSTYADKTEITLSDHTGTIDTELPFSVSVEQGKNVTVFGYVKNGKIIAHKMFLQKPTGFSMHTYVIKTLPELQAGIVSAPPEAAVGFSKAINYASYTLAGLLVFLSIMLVVRRFRG